MNKTSIIAAVLRDKIKGTQWSYQCPEESQNLLNGGSYLQIDMA